MREKKCAVAPDDGLRVIRETGRRVSVLLNNEIQSPSDAIVRQRVEKSAI